MDSQSKIFHPMALKTGITLFFAGIDTYFNEAVKASIDKSSAVATVKTLLYFIEKDNCKCFSAFAGLLLLDSLLTFALLASTFQELSKNIRNVIDVLKTNEPSAEVESVSEIFLRYTTLKASQFAVSIAS